MHQEDWYPNLRFVTTLRWLPFLTSQIALMRVQAPYNHQFQAPYNHQTPYNNQVQAS
jgi:hypothetical protein